MFLFVKNKRYELLHSFIPRSNEKKSDKLKNFNKLFAIFLYTTKHFIYFLYII